MTKKIETSVQLVNILPESGANTCIIDGGCYVGSFSLELQLYYPQERVLAFEPGAQSWSKARDNIGHYKHIELINSALGESEGKAEYFQGPYAATNSLLPRPDTDLNQYYPSDAFLEGGTWVDVTTIDVECKKRGIDLIKIMKLDLQGGELAALKGAKDYIETSSVNVIIIEVVFVRKYENQPLLWEVWSYLDRHDYSLYSLEEVKVGLYENHSNGLRQGQWNQCDAIFISKDIRRKLDA